MIITQFLLQDSAQNTLIYVLHIVHWNGLNFPKTQHNKKTDAEKKPG